MTKDQEQQPHHRAADDVSLEELTALCDIMVSLSKAGVPLDRGLVTLAEDLPGRLGTQAAEISQQLKRGARLSEVVSSEGSAFPPVYSSVVEAGMRSGRTTAALEGFARLARQLAELRRLVLSSLVYPLVLMVVLTVISVTVLRRIPSALDEFLRDHFLGTPSEGEFDYLMQLYQSVTDWFWVIPLALIAVGLFWVAATRSAKAAQGEDRDWVAWVPGAGRLLRNSRLLAFTDILYLLVEQRVPLHEAVRLAGNASGDRTLRTDAAELSSQLERGETAATAATPRQANGIPGFLRWGLCNSRQLGQLESTLDRARSMYRYRTEDAAMRLRTLLPVCFSFFLGGFLVLVYVALFLVPWFSILHYISEPLQMLR